MTGQSLITVTAASREPPRPAGAGRLSCRGRGEFCLGGDGLRAGAEGPQITLRAGVVGAGPGTFRARQKAGTPASRPGGHTTLIRKLNRTSGNGRRCPAP